MNITLNTELSIKTLLRIQELFQFHEWEIEDSDDNENSLYERFCSLFGILDEEEQELLFKLTENHFKKISLEDYTEYTKDALRNMKQIMKEKFENIDKIYVLPLLRPDDKGKIKSSTLVAYLFQSPELKYQKFLKDKSFEVISDLENIKINKITGNDKAILLVVDDFIGTGGTAIECLNHIMESYNITKDKIIVLSLVAQKRGVSEINSKNIKVFTAKNIGRGISDNFFGDDKEKAKNIMRNIEKRIKLKKDHDFGYKESEALISLIRTPNNTFPVFWREKYPFRHRAPFPRKER